MNRSLTLTIMSLAAVATLLGATKKPSLMVMDMVHHNPGEAMTESKFLDPNFLKNNGFDAKVFFLFEAAQFGVDWQSFDPTLFDPTTEAGRWVAHKNKIINQKYSQAKAAGLQVYCMLDMLVLPSALVDKHRSELTNEKGKIDISKPYTQLCIRAMMSQMFETFPQLDGLVIRTGETYLHDAPHYVGNHPVQRGMDDHVTLINLLRDEVCNKRGKNIFYRTWDIGQLHSIPRHYLSVTDRIEPHPNLYFSIKHTMTDFWRSAVTNPQKDYNTMETFWLEESGQHGIPFNPCIGIGRHKQIVEVQCQREYEGKAAHPNYIAKGVIDGFEEFRNNPQTKQPYCLNHLTNNPLLAGVWTWSRGGGWGGPYIKNEFWLEVNAYVMSQWAGDPSRSEAEILNSFARSKGLPKRQLSDFRRLCLLSEDGVMKGQYSAMGDVFVNWTRDATITGTMFQNAYFDRMIQRGEVEAYLAEKREAVGIWREIEAISRGLKFSDEALNHFVRTSCSYGRIKYELFAASWHIMLRGHMAENSGTAFDRSEMNGHIADFDRLWAEWNQLVRDNNDSPTIYAISSSFFGVASGIKETVDKYRWRGHHGL